MTTSLADQLKRLATPQTSLLVQDKKKTSFLFDPREAAKLDRETFYELGVSGLDELVKLNPKFQEFKSSLFDPASRTLERAVQNEEANKALNKLIRKFLLLLSPYFLIKAAHKALEWLVVRFHIESFNVDDLMALILPYHNTRIFVRALQMVDISSPTNKWNWLHPLQKPGVPLSKTALFNHCASNPSFIKFICETTRDALKEYEDRGNALSTLLAFHCTTLIGGLEHTKYVDELQVTHLLESLLKGLVSKVEDYVAASYMILAQLVRRAKLNHHVFFSLFHKVVKCPHSSLTSECVLLMVHMYQNQEVKLMPSIPNKTVNALMKLKWLPEALGQLRNSGVYVNELFMPLLRDLLLSIQSVIDSRKEMCEFTESLIQESLDGASAQQALEVIVECFKVEGLVCSKKKTPTKDKKRKTPTKDESEGKNMMILNAYDSEEVVKWYSKFFQSLEHKFSESFDKVIHKYLSKYDASSLETKAVRVLLGVTTDSSTTPLKGSLFERVHHPNPSLRAEAVRCFVESYSSLEVRDKDLISAVVVARLKDDSVEVVREMLAFSTEDLIEVLGSDASLMELIALSKRCLNHRRNKNWSAVGVLLVQHLCSLQATSAAVEIQILLALLPFLFDTDSEVSSGILKQHSLVKTCKFLTLLSDEFEKGGETSITPKNVCSTFVKCLLKEDKFADVEILLECAQKIASEEGKCIHVFLVFLLLGSSITEEIPPAVSQKILDLLTCIEKYKIVVVRGYLMRNDGKRMLDSIVHSQKGELPLSGPLYCLLQLTKYTPLPDTLKSEDRKWWNLESCKDDENQDALRFHVRILEVLLKGCGQKTASVRLCYTDCLKECLKFQFPSLVTQMRFLCNISAYSGTERDGLSWLEFRLRCLHLLSKLWEIIKNGMNWITDLNEPIVPALLIASSSPLIPLRQTALKCLEGIGTSQADDVKDTSFVSLVIEIKQRCEEIKQDAEQLPLVIYTSLSPDPAVQSLLKATEIVKLDAIRNALFSCITSKEAPMYVKMCLLDIMLSVNSPDIVIKLVPLAVDLLSGVKEFDGYLDENRSAILCNIIQRLTFETVSCLKNPEFWSFIETAMLDWKTKVLLSDGKLTLLAALIMKQISHDLFEALDESLQQKLLALIIKAASDCEFPEVSSAAGRAVRKIVLESKIVAAELEKMKDAQIPFQESSSLPVKLRARRNVNLPPCPELLQTDSWRYGVTLLEWLQSKKKLHSTQLLLAPLFSILSKCLEFEEQSPVEYTKQLVLSCILHCCQKLSPEGTPVDKSVMQAFNVESVVQCIRASQNPQTHHHALLLLGHIAGMLPEQVLHNIMAIFTFMGTSILRQEDAYSFQVISKIVDTIIPILVKASEEVVGHSSAVDGAVCAVIRVFADTVVHVPAHRRSVLYQKLLTTVGVERSLWLFVCLVLEGHVVHGKEENSQATRQQRGEIPHRQEFILNLTLGFPPQAIIFSCIRLVEYLRSLPIQKEQSDKPGKDRKRESSFQLTLVTELFNVDIHTAKQLRHYRYSICTLLSSLLSSPQFLQQVAELSDTDIFSMEPLYQELIEKLLTYIKIVSRQHAQNTQKEKVDRAKYWNAMLNLAYDILDKVNALLPGPMFLLVIRGLMDHKLQAIRRKAMELLNLRLQHQPNIFKSCEREAFYNILDPLVAALGSADEENVEPDVETNQQVAMMSIKFISRQLAYEDPDHFKPILEKVTVLVKSKTVQKNLLASALLCLAELVSTLRVHAIGQLNQIMPAIIKIFKRQKDIDSPSLVLLSIVTALEKIVESLPNFLSPYLEKLLFVVSIQSIRWQSANEDNKVLPVLNKLKAIRQKLSTCLPSRVLIPVVEQCYSRLLEHRKYSAIGSLLSVLSDNFSTLTGSELTQLIPELTTFFLSALQFRAGADESVSKEDISDAEGHVVHCMMALILKLSESTFRTLFDSLFHWANTTEQAKDRIITFYRLTSKIADGLKGLFNLFAGRFVMNAAKLLVRLNPIKSRQEGEEEEEMEVDNDEEPAYDEQNSQLLIQYILKTFNKIFKYDSAQSFVNKDRFDMLMLPIVNQLDNTVGGIEALQARVSSLISPCISEFAAAVANDGLWKQLNYQILLKTRHSLREVRLAALQVLCDMVRKLGEDFIPLLPETVPFLAELLEDDDETVETACQKAVQELEEILGEPLKKYF